ncbi:HAD hydrolase-like protein [Lentisphaerota bacterium ZTH]|nr:HAD hydrolase-like protein [Lentisphaerota bacterium]WET05629.1 HAD hydrolase-like protein [Lentisphaerota bacterium ZTH]
MNTFYSWWEKNRKNIQALLFDIDGTLVSGLNLLAGADRLLAELRAQNFPFFLLTNDGNHSTLEKSGLMAKAGLHVAPDEIVSCSMALDEFTEVNNLKGRMFFVMGDLGKPCYAEWAGLEVCRDLEQIYECDGILIGEGLYNWYDNIQAAFNFLLRYPDRPLIVPNPDGFWPKGKNGEFGIGAGGKARFICSLLAEAGKNVSPVYLGKPYSHIYLYTLHLLKKRFGIQELPEKDVMMLGDSLHSDILGANMLGIKSGLMLTGITTAEQADEASGNYRPDFVFNALI